MGGKANREYILQRHMDNGIKCLSLEDKEGWFLGALTLKLRLEVAENLTRQGASPWPDDCPVLAEVWGCVCSLCKWTIRDQFLAPQCTSVSVFRQ